MTEFHNQMKAPLEYPIKRLEFEWELCQYKSMQ